MPWMFVTMFIFGQSRYPHRQYFWSIGRDLQTIISVPNRSRTITTPKQFKNLGMFIFPSDELHNLTLLRCANRFSKHNDVDVALSKRLYDCIEIRCQ